MCDEIAQIYHWLPKYKIRQWAVDDLIAGLMIIRIMSTRLKKDGMAHFVRPRDRCLNVSTAACLIPRGDLASAVACEPQ